MPWHARLPGPLLAALHFALGLPVLLDPRIMHDEGQAMYGFSRSLSEAFIPCLFFQKTKPALALVYAVPARLGFVPYLIAHLLVGSIAVMLLCRVAETMGQQRPWVPALVLALSPLYLWNSATGISNADGVAGIVLFLYLLEARRWRFAAGLVLGALPWVRFEAAMFCAIAAPFVLARDRDRRFFAGLLSWPVLYLVGGAIYHRMPLWFVSITPATMGLQPWHVAEAQTFASHSAQSAIESFVCVSPALTVLLFCRWQRLSSMERALLIFSLAYFGLYVATHFRALPIGPLFVVGFAARYAGLPLATAALLAGRAVESIEEDRTRDRDLVLIVAVIVLGVWAKIVGAGPGVLLSACAIAVAVAAARANLTHFGVAAFALFVAAGTFIARPAMSRAGYSRAAIATRRSVEEMTRALEAMDPAALRVGVYTNNHTLPLYLQRTGRLAGIRVRFIIGPDIDAEMTQQTNPANGQRAAVLAAVPRAMFGDAVLPHELQPDRVPVGTVIATFDDPRNELSMPSATWTPRLRMVSERDGLKLAIVGPAP